jgi:hypothetical protein
MMKKTPVVLAFFIVALLAYDMYALIYFGWDETISVATLQLSKKFPVVPFLAGLVCGHLFWPQEPKNEAPKDGTKPQ